MIKIKTKKQTVMFNMSEREVCGICGHPSGFCKHTMEADYREHCPDSPKTKEQIWQFTRDLAIAKTYTNNLWHYQTKELKEIKQLKFELDQRIKQLESFSIKLAESLGLTQK